jgi:gamma-glutamyl:cysteine ligase YbdK (ATP-grasp superfamily)
MWTGRSEPMADHLHALLDHLEPAARQVGCAEQLRAARDLVDAPRADAAREVGHEGGAQALAAWLAKRFTG